MVQNHLELVEEVPPPGVALPHVVVEVPGREPERVEGAVGVQQEDRGGLLVGQTGVIACKSFSIFF